MSILDTLIGTVAPYDCLSCGKEGSLVCVLCSDTLTAAPERCYRCQTYSSGFLTCEACRPKSRLQAVRVAAVYEKTAKALIWKLKLAGTQAAAGIIAKRLAALMEDTTPRTVIVPVPTATSRVRQRGYDQSKLLARELARQTRLPYRSYLARSGQTHQHGLSRQQRLAQLAAAFRATHRKALHGRPIILVDDVTTTGATLEAAAAALQAAGANQIEAVVFAQPQRGSEYIRE